MGKKYVVYEVDDGGGGGSSDTGEVILFFIVILALVGLYMKFFGAYDDSDFSKHEYIARSKAGAEELVLEWQGRNWRPRGFTDEFQILSNEPEFKTTVIHPAEQPAPQYLGHGVFQVAVETNTKLTSKSGKSVIVQEGFIVQIKSNASHGWLYRVFRGDDWRIIAAEQVYMSPTLPEINNLIAQWSSSKS